MDKDRAFCKVLDCCRNDGGFCVLSGNDIPDNIFIDKPMLDCSHYRFVMRGELNGQAR